MTDITTEAAAQERDLDSLGPVDYIVVEFPAGASNFTGEMSKELIKLVDAGTIRLIDVLILTKDADGSVEAMELSDIENLGELQALEAELAELLALVDAGTIRVIDILILEKSDDGSIDAIELSDVGELGELQALEAELAELLAAEDVAHLAAAMDPGSVAGVLVYENLWAAPFAAAARRSGGQLIANGRIPIQAIIASIEADEAASAEGD